MKKLSAFLSIDSCYNRIKITDPDTLAIRVVMYRDFFVCTLCGNSDVFTVVVMKPPITLVVLAEKYG